MSWKPFDFEAVILRPKKSLLCDAALFINQKSSFYLTQMSSHKILTVYVIILNVRLYFTCWSILLFPHVGSFGMPAACFDAGWKSKALTRMRPCIAARSLYQPVLWASVQHTELCLKDLPSSSKSVFPSFFSSVSFSLFCLSPPPVLSCRSACSSHGSNGKPDSTTPTVLPHNVHFWQSSGRVWL